MAKKWEGDFLHQICGRNHREPRYTKVLVVIRIFHINVVWIVVWI